MLPFSRNLATLNAWLLVALTDLAVVVPWILLFYRGFISADWHTAVPGVWLALAVYAAAGIWEAGDRGNEATLGRRRAIAMVAGLAGAYLAAYFLLPAGMRTGLLSGNAAWAFIPAAAYLWYQGTQAVVEGLGYDRIFSRYPMQVASAAAGIVALSYFGGTREPQVQVLLYWSVLLLLVGGLFAMIVGRERKLRAGQASFGEKSIGSVGQSRLVSVGVLALLGLTLAASKILSVQRMEAITSAVGGVLSAVFNWFGAVIYLILYRWMMLIGPAIERFVQWLTQMYARAQGNVAPEVKDGEAQDRLQQAFEPVFDFEKFMHYLTVALIIALVIGVIIAVARMAAKRRRPLAASEEEIINLGFWPNLLNDLKSLFQPRAAAIAAAISAAEKLDPREPRMLFRRLQNWGAGRGRPRQESETPNAYGGALGAEHPEQSGAVATVTAIYNQAKYGAAPPEGQQVAAAADAVAGLEALEPNS
ncbi:MAG TPA: DUF4129 domain-containing protein [Symbiobacteriaceae bacterium]|nr:DUF4129 domain-containing protein [Symbiobacteriaceae bacterium]